MGNQKEAGGRIDPSQGAKNFDAITVHGSTQDTALGGGKFTWFMVGSYGGAGGEQGKWRVGRVRRGHDGLKMEPELRYRRESGERVTKEEDIRRKNGSWLFR